MGKGALLASTDPTTESFELHTYQIFTHRFSVRWRDGLGDEARRVLEPFEAAPAQAPLEADIASPLYSIEEVTEAGRRQCRVFHDGASLVLSDDPVDATDYMLWHVYAEARKATTDLLLVHAGSVVAPSGDVLLLPAPKGSGKTTLVIGLVRAGFGFLSDEFAAIDPVSRTILRSRKALAVKRGVHGLFPELAPPSARGADRGRWHVRPEALGGDTHIEPGNVRFVISPKHRQGSDTRLRPISRSTGLMRTAENGLNVQAFDGNALELIADLITGADCYELEIGSLDEAVTAIVELVDSGTAQRS